MKIANISTLISIISLICFAIGCSQEPRSHGPDINALIESDDSVALQQLVDSGWDINSKIPDGADDETTPLNRACVLVKLSCVKILLENGADPNLPSGNGFPPICSLLWNIGNPLRDPELSKKFINRDSVAIFHLLMQHGADLKKEGPIGNAYETAKRFGNLEAMELIRQYEPGIAR